MQAALAALGGLGGLLGSPLLQLQAFQNPASLQQLQQFAMFQQHGGQTPPLPPQAQFFLQNHVSLLFDVFNTLVGCVL